MPEFVTSEGHAVQPVLPENPEKYGWASAEPDAKDNWRGCNHCGRVVPETAPRVEWLAPGRHTTRMHSWCFMKVYQREYAKALYGRDIFITT